MSCQCLIAVSPVWLHVFTYVCSWYVIMQLICNNAVLTHCKKIGLRGQETRAVGGSGNLTKAQVRQTYLGEKTKGEFYMNTQTSITIYRPTSWFNFDPPCLPWLHCHVTLSILWCVKRQQQRGHLWPCFLKCIWCIRWLEPVILTTISENRTTLQPSHLPCECCVRTADWQPEAAEKRSRFLYGLTTSHSGIRLGEDLKEAVQIICV